MKWQPEVSKYLQAENYTAVIEFYEELIQREESILNCCRLGLAYLLEGREEEANATWLSLLTETEGIDELLEILEAEATRQTELKNLQKSLLIREYIREINPNLVDNQLEIILLTLELGTFEVAELNQLIPLIQGEVNVALLLEVIKAVLKYPSLETIELVRVSLPYLDETFLKQVEELNIVETEGNNIFYLIDLLEVSLQLKPDHLYFLNGLVHYYGKVRNQKKAEETIVKFITHCSTLDLQLYGEYFYLYYILTQGKWLEIEPIIKKYKNILEQFNQAPPEKLHDFTSLLLPLVTIPLLYLQDNPQENHYWQNRISKIFQEKLRELANLPKITTFAKRERSGALKIGYLARTLKRHSVGWLARWLFHYHDRNSLEISAYLINQVEDDLTKQWISKNVAHLYNLPENPFLIAQQIFSDKIDILVDLDSVTNSISCAVMALKPAPIQVTWLGFDASGIPNIDYFIVDHHVLPENAQEYYHEKLWRLPQTYVAIDGFEVGVPTLTRERLNIPSDAVIYLTAQVGMKRHPETIRLQLKILKAVPNSYLLIQGHIDDTMIQILFNKLAEEEGIKTERLRFLDREPEEVYYANLQIADIVLDTYPFGGGTTTLGFLWMAIPIVTLVGQQLAARNSYTFMLNAGITEGIANTREEYIEWGVKLGLNEELRSSIHWKLLKNRQTAPVWNAKKFTQEIEKAYYEMASRNL